MLHVLFTPSSEEVAWAEQRTGRPESRFALVLALKCFQKMARFPSPDEILEVVIDHVVAPATAGTARVHDEAVRAAVEQAGGFAAQLADIEEVAAFHGDAHELVVYRFFKKDRPTLFELAGKLRLKATSSDDSGAGRAGARPRALTQAPRLHPAVPGCGGGRSGVGHRVRLRQLAARGDRPQTAGHGGAAALRGDGALLPGRGTAHRRRGRPRLRRVR
ncbi:DUF4158 domain-containing protein [Nonomuraea sp. NPDC050383]|uniref:DUF4158 domain-containing protein n=1 Tax=Nonomuraea sp. NPDC050383 TaxID=3364362 RepID=UPI00379D21CE